MESKFLQKIVREDSSHEFHTDILPRRKKVEYVLSPSLKKKTYASPFVTEASRTCYETNQTTVLEEIIHHIVIVYGNPLPVLVTEALITDVQRTDMTVYVDKTGWATMVCGRTLYIWKFKKEPTAQSFVSHCRVLTLPSSDLAHKSDLVKVFQDSGAVMPSVLAVSPEGTVRYWPNINHEEESVDATAELQGQECYSLTEVHPMKYILATTTGTFIQITLVWKRGQPYIHCRTIKEAQGILSGIGRKVTSFIFGAMPSQSEKQVVKVLTTDDDSEGNYVMYVLSVHTLQKWEVTECGPDKLVFEHDMQAVLIRKFFDELMQGCDPTQMHQLRVWCLDMQFYKRGIAILGACANLAYSTYAYYGLAMVDIVPPSPVSPETYYIASFINLKHCERYQEENYDWLWKLRLIMPSKDSPYMYMYSISEIFCISLSQPETESDTIDTHRARWGNVLGAGVYNNLPLFFTRLQCLLAFQYVPHSVLSASVTVTAEQEALMDKNVEEPINMHTSLRACMCKYYNNEHDECQEHLRKLFPTDEFLHLDEAVIDLSTEIINDYPVSDPRWFKSVPTGESFSRSLIILHQLEDKLRVHEYLVNFIKSVGLYGKLSTTSIRDVNIPTTVLLCEHAEKLIAMKTIRRLLLSDDGEIIDSAMKECVEYQNANIPEMQSESNLTYQDLFFREVSKVENIFTSLVNLALKPGNSEGKMNESDCKTLVAVNDKAQKPGTSSEKVNESDCKTLIAVNDIILEIIHDALQFRKSKEDYYGIVPNTTHYQPWTCNPSGLRSLMSRQACVTIQYSKKVTENIGMQEHMLKQAEDFIDTFLSEHMRELESVKNTKLFASIEESFVQERKHLIELLAEVELLEKALVLAEKFSEFKLMIQICDSTNQEERLQNYAVLFKDQGFLECTLKWYLKRGKKEKILSYCQALGVDRELTDFAKDIWDIQWLHDVNKGRYLSAQKALVNLATKENKSCAKRKTLLSMAKIATLTADMSDADRNMNLEYIDHHLNHILHQERMPDSVIEAEKINPADMNMWSADLIIETFISEKNTNADCSDFKTALDMLEFLPQDTPDAEREKLRCRIWSYAVLRDEWHKLDLSTPESIQKTVFFQVVKLGHEFGLNLSEYIVPFNDLLEAPELKHVADDPRFLFSLKVAYDMIPRYVAPV